MVFIRYFCKRFFINFFSITIVLTLVYNGLEFFEKLVSVSSQTNVSQILFFTGLNILPTYASFIPVGCWLAMCALIREFAIRDEWNILLLLNITSHQIIKISTLTACCSVIFGFFFYEFVAIPLTDYTARYKMHSFKKASPHIINKKWILADKRIFCRLEHFNLQTKEGTHATLIYLTENYTIARTIKAYSYSIDLNSNHFTILNGHEIDHQRHQQESISNKSIKIPSLSLGIKPNYEQTSSFIKTTKQLWQAITLDARHVSEDLWRIIIERIFFYFKILVYPIITFAFFILLAHTKHLKWLMIVLPYPFMMLASILLHSVPSPLFSCYIFAVIILVLFTTLGILSSRAKNMSN